MTTTKQGNAHVIDCADCQHPYVTIRKNTKYCGICRLDRNLSFLHQKKRKAEKCPRCDKLFMPIERQQGLCGECSHLRTDRALQVRGRCGLCLNDDMVLCTQDLGVCHRCSTDPEKRAKLQKGVAKKAIDRTANPPTEEERAHAQERCEAING